MAAPELPPALLALVTDFLNSNGYDKAATQIEKQAKKQGLTLEKDTATPSLTTVYESWQSQQTTPAAKDSASSSSDETSDSDSSDSDSEKKTPSRKRKASSPPSDDSSSASDASSSDNSSDDSSDDSSSSESEAEVAPPAKKSKTVRNTKAPSPAASSSASSASESSSSSSSSESDSSSDESSSSESDDAESSSSSDSSSDSDSESEPEPVKPKKSKKSEKSEKSDKSTKTPKASKPAKAAAPKVEVATNTAPNDSDSSATLAGDSPVVDTLVIPAADNSEFMHPDRKRKLPASFNQTNEEQTVPATEENIKRLKKENIPFSRIPKDQFVDPKFSDNTYQSYDYADKAHEALIVTKGKAFTKAKNKGKRGSYRGGKIDLTPKGIKFED